MNTTVAPKKNTEPVTCESLASFYKASGDELRLDILRILEKDTFGVMELATIFDVKQSAMSHHLKVLLNAGLVESQREGNSIFYRRPLLVEPSCLTPAKSQLFELLDQTTIKPETIAGIENISHQRAAQSEAFFAKNSEHFRQQQELIADFALYSEPVAELIKQKKAQNHQSALEIGPGEGEFLPVLSKLFDTVFAVDNSQSMLAKAQSLVTKRELKNVNCMLGTTTDLRNQANQFDVIAMNMVLHHVPSPASLIGDCGELLTPKGILFICDLNRHDQQWAHDSCGDLWLGFSPEEITKWAEQAGLTESESLYLGVRNGFQIQIRQFTQLS